MSLLLGPLGGKRSFNPRQELFSNNEQGLWLDPSDMTAGKAAWRRNLLGYTEALSLSPWTADGATFSANTTVAPDGTTTAGTFTGASGNYRIYQQRTSVVGASHTISLYVKQGTSPTVQIDYINVNNGPVFTFATESFSTVGGFTTNVQNVGSGWYRLSITATNINSNPGPGFRASGATTFFIWGVQYEQSSTPTEYQRITDFSTEFKAAFPTHTLYQDSNGVTPCTAAGDPVGLILDQSRGGLGALGANLITSFDMTAAGWSVVGAGTTKTASTFTTTAAGGVAIGHSHANNPLTNGKVYRYTLSVSCSTSSTFSFRDGGGTLMFSAEVPVSSTPVEINGLANINTTNGLYFRGSAAATYTIHSFTAREVPGNHAYQTSSGARPTLARIPSSGRRNLLSYSEQLTNTAEAGSTRPWAVSAGANTVTPNYAQAPDGTNTANRFVFTSSSFAGRQQQIPVSLVAGQAYTFSIWIKRISGSNSGRLEISGGGGTVISGFQTITGTADWQRVSLTLTAVGSGTASVYVYPEYAASATGEYLLWGAQLETGSSPTNYQKVVATTDVTESGVSDLWHLVFDGSDDSLTTNSIDMTGTDEMTVIAGVRKLSDAAQIIAELGTSFSLNTGSFYLVAGADPSNGYTSASRGTQVSASTQVAASLVNQPDSSVIATTHDISSDLTTLRRNAVSATDATGEKGAGNFGNYQLFIGRRNQFNLPFNGHIYQLIIRGKTTPTGKLLEAERFVARKTGVTGI